MKVFLTGANGFIGSAIAKELIADGHQVIGLARTDEAAKTIMAAGLSVQKGSLSDLESLKKGAVEVDAVIHTAFVHGFSKISLGSRLKVIFGGLPGGIAGRFLTKIAKLDSDAIEAMGAVLENSNKPLIITSGTMILPLGRMVSEKDNPNAASPAAYRMHSEEVAMKLAKRGVRTSIVRLPPTVHGDGDKGFLSNLVNTAKKSGVSAYVKDGQNNWPAVHRLDAAHLFKLVLDKGVAGEVYHGVAEEGIPFLEIANAIAKKLNIPTAEKPPKHFSFLGSIVAADNPTSATKTKEFLGWETKHPTLINDIVNGKYF